MDCLLYPTFLSLASKPSVLSATFHAPKTSRTDALHLESSMRWRYGWIKRVPEGTEGLFWSGLLSSLEISFEVRSWGWMDPWPQGIRRACVKSLIWLYPSLHLALSLSFQLPASLAIFVPIIAWAGLRDEADVVSGHSWNHYVESGQRCVCRWACSLNTLVVTINLFI